MLPRPEPGSAPGSSEGEGIIGCTGCGLVDSIGEIAVATSGQWGGPGLNFGLDGTDGAPIFADSTGELRTVPDRIATVFSSSDSSAPAVTLDAPGTNSHTVTDILSTFTAGDRPVRMLFHVVGKFGFSVAGFGATGIALHVLLSLDSLLVDIARLVCYPDVDAEGAALTFPYDLEEIISESYAIDLPAGWTGNVNLGLKIDVTGRTGVVTWDTAAVGLRYLAIEGRA